MKRVQTFRTLTGAILATSMLAGAPMAQAQQMPGTENSASAGLADREGGWGGRQQGQGGQRKEWSGGRGESNRAERAAPQQRAERPAPQQRAERVPPLQRAERAPSAPRAAERQGREWNRSDRKSETAQVRSGRDWNQSQDRGASVRSYPERAVRTAPAERVRNDTPRYGSDRDRTYRDRDRNTTYSDRHRDGDRRWEGSRDGRNYRDGDHHRDGVRYRDRDRDGRYADRDRHHRWDHHWRNNNRYDWQRYRTHNHHIYRMGHYYSPYRDYRYRRLSIGFTLGSLFYGSRYWINDPWRYRLPDVYGPYRWVRYYDDVLLVDMYSGEVVDVIYDFFW